MRPALNRHTEDQLRVLIPCLFRHFNAEMPVHRRIDIISRLSTCSISLIEEGSKIFLLEGQSLLSLIDILDVDEFAQEVEQYPGITDDLSPEEKRGFRNTLPAALEEIRGSLSVSIMLREARAEMANEEDTDEDSDNGV